MQAEVPADTPIPAAPAPSAEAINTVELTEDERRKLRAQRFGGSVGGPLGKVRPSVWILPRTHAMVERSDGVNVSGAGSQRVPLNWVHVFSTADVAGMQVDVAENISKLKDRAKRFGLPTPVFAAEVRRQIAPTMHPSLQSVICRILKSACVTRICCCSTWIA